MQKTDENYNDIFIFADDLWFCWFSVRLPREQYFSSLEIGRCSVLLRNVCKSVHTFPSKSIYLIERIAYYHLLKNKLKMIL